MNALQLTMIPQQTTPVMTVSKNSQKTLSVRYFKSLDLITILGWSVNEDVWTHYCQVLADIETHFLYEDKLHVYFKLEDFNACSARYFFRIIQRLNKAHAAGKNVKIHWACDAQNEMLDTGKNLKGMSDFPYEIAVSK